MAEEVNLLLGQSNLDLTELLSVSGVILGSAGFLSLLGLALDDRILKPVCSTHIFKCCLKSSFHSITSIYFAFEFALIERLEFIFSRKSNSIVCPDSGKLYYVVTILTRNNLYVNWLAGGFLVLSLADSLGIAVLSLAVTTCLFIESLLDSCDF